MLMKDSVKLFKGGGVRVCTYIHFVREQWSAYLVRGSSAILSPLHSEHDCA